MHPTPDPQTFREAFAALRPLILDEWPDLGENALDETEGDLDQVTALIAEHAGRTKALTRRLLAELLGVVSEKVRPPPPPRRSNRATREPESSVAEPVESLVSSLEAHLEDLTREVKRDVAPLAADTAREHLGLVLLLTAGIAFAVGLFLGALGYPHDQREESDGAD